MVTYRQTPCCQTKWLHYEKDNFPYISANSFNKFLTISNVAISFHQTSSPQELSALVAQRTSFAVWHSPDVFTALTAKCNSDDQTTKGEMYDKGIAKKNGSNHIKLILG